MLQTASVDLKKLSDVVNKEVVKNTVYNKLIRKENNLENKTPDAPSLFDLHQYKIDKQDFQKQIVIVENKIPDVSVYVNTTVFNTKIGKAENKVTETNSLVTPKTTVVEKKIAHHAKYITTFLVQYLRQN